MSDPTPPSAAVPRAKRFRSRSNYFVAHDLVWVRPAGLPYWPAEVLESDEPHNRVRARLILPPARALLDANLKAEEAVWARVQKRHAAEMQTKRQRRDVQRAKGHATGDEDADAKDVHAALVVPPREADVVTASGNSVFFFDKLATTEEFEACVEDRLQRKSHDVSAYEADFMKAVMHANRLVRTVLTPEKLKPYTVCGVGVVHSLMRHHIAAPRQPHTGTFEPQTAVICLRRGLENATRDLSGFEYIWVLFQFSYAAAFATGEGQAYVNRKKQQEEEASHTAGTAPPHTHASTSASEVNGGGEEPSLHPWTNRQGITHAQGFKTLLVPPRDDTLRGVFATRSPHRPNFIGLSCVRLVRVQGLEIHIADHDLLHGTPVLDIKPYLPFCDAHPAARAGWVAALDSSGGGKGDHKVAEQTRQVDRIFVASPPPSAEK